VAELILRCKTTEGVVEKRVEHDAEVVYVRRCFARRSALTHSLQLMSMGLTEVPSELFCMKNVKQLFLYNNKLCSLPSEIAHLATLEGLIVRLSERLDRDLTESHVVFQVNGNQLTSLPCELGLLINLTWLDVRHWRQADRDLTVLRAFRSATTSSRRSQQKSASSHSSRCSRCETRVEWIVI
jgi:hypothetical protein